jgi:hypothetical protein
MRFVMLHWRGELPLLTSVCGVGLVAAPAFAAISKVLFIGASALDLSIPASSAAELIWLVVCAVICVWAAVGIWRAAEASPRKTRWGSRAVLGILALLLLPVAQRSALSATELFQLSMGSDPLGKPADMRFTNGDLVIDGPLALGSGDRFAALVSGAQVPRTVLLTSSGGRVAEAEAIGAWVKAHGIPTRGRDYCESACTLILLSGPDRTVEPGTDVGFHQTTFAGNTEEEDKLQTDLSRSSFLLAGVSPAFIDRAFSARPDDMWYPSQEEMLESGFLTRRIGPTSRARAGTRVAPAR